MKIISATFVFALAATAVKAQPVVTSTDQNAYWSVVNYDGSECVIVDGCIKSHAGAGMTRYEHDEMCTFTAKQEGVAHTIFFNTERCCDHLFVNSEVNRGAAVTVADQTEFEWNTDGNVARRGFQICYGAPLEDSNDHWSVTNVLGSDCVIDGECLRSHAGAGVQDYMNHESCDFTAKQDGTLRTRFFNTEAGFDYFTLNGEAFSGTGVDSDSDDNPLLAATVTANTVGMWDTDRSITGLGFEVCYGLPATDENSYWSLDILPGSECVIDGPCIKSHPTAGIERYQNHELCQFTAKKDGTLISRFFETEPCCDHVMIGDDEFNGRLGGRTPPASIRDGVPIEASEYLLWDTDGSVVRKGFVICFEGSGGSGPFWELDDPTSNECVIEDRCIKSHDDAGMGFYENNQRCLFQALQTGTISASFFRTESCCDHVTIATHRNEFNGNGNERRRRIRGRGMPLVTHDVWPGTEVVWDSDGSVRRYGFEVCYDLSGAGQGDPHFKLWSGDWFDFHGICDQVLTTSPSFGNGLGLDIHIRTKPRYQYSYIEATAIKIGDDVLEVGSWGQYWFNGVEGTRLPKMMAGKYAVEKILDTKKQHTFVITLDKRMSERIVVHVMKDLVNVNVERATMGSFSASSGLLGTFPDGIMLARNGSTVVEGHDTFGQEWQVMALDPQLFQSINKNQQEVGVCAPPVVTERRRLGEGIKIGAAEKACAHHSKEQEKDMCVFDVMAMGDLEMAGINGAF